MTDHLVLIFAYHYPPENTIGGARPFRFSKYLSKLGYKCRVFTAAEQIGCNDPDTEYVPDPFITHSRRSPSWQLERALRKLFLPGELGMQWSYYAARAARAYIRSHPSTYVTFFSTYPPLGPHLAAWQLARSEGRPWVADFRDPFPDGLGYMRAHPFQKRICRRLEGAIARRADAVIANTDGALLRWREEFPNLNGKFQLIWNGFDPETRVRPLSVPSGACRVLTHTGELYGGRSAKPLLESIARLIATNRLSAQNVRVRLIGPAETDALPNHEFLNGARAQGWLELVNELIPQPEALNIARTSHSLLLLQLRSSVHIPAKIFEYVQIGRPILAFVDQDSPSERLLERSGVPYRCVYPGSAPEAIDNVVAEFFSLASEPVAVSPWFEEHFNAEKQTRQLDAIIHSVHNEPVRDSNPLSAPLISAKNSMTKQEAKI